MQLQVHQCSLHAEGPPGDVPAQVMAAVKRGAFAIGFTELSKQVDIAAVYRLCAEHGYMLYKGTNDTAIAWDIHAALIGKGEVPTGASRSLVWVTLDYHGEQITVVEQHWVTGTYDKSHPGETRAKQSQAMIDAVTTHAEGHDLAFWMGDTNANFANAKDTIRVALDKAGLVSAYEERNKYLPTLGKNTCDVVGHFAPDTRVHCGQQHKPTDPCSRCGHALGPIGSWLHYDHTDSSDGYLGFSHGSRPCPVCGRRCNIRAGAQKANRNSRRPIKRAIIRSAESLRW
jgi:hypothetical protein